MRGGLAIFGIMLALACGSSSTAPPPTDGSSSDVISDGGQQLDIPESTTLSPWVMDAGDGVICVVEADPFRIVLKRHEKVLVELNAGQLGLGLVDAIDEDKSYDPYWLHHSLGITSAPEPEGLNWQGIERTDPWGMGTIGRGVQTRGWLEDGSSVTLVVEPSATGSVALTITPDDTPPVGFMYWQFPAEPDENFYGLGENFDHVARRGTYRSMLFQPLLNTESGYNEGHVPVPLLLSTRGPGFFLESRKPAYFDVGYTDPDIVRMELGNADSLKLHLIGTEHPMEAIGRYHELTGRPLVPPYWAFGPHFWRNETSGQEEVLQDLENIRSLDIPASVFWIDRPYQQSYNDCVFDPERYSDPAAMSQTFTDRGFKLVLWHAPYTSEESDAFEQANSENMFVEGPQIFLTFGRLMDFTNPATVDLWQDLLSRFSSLGVAGYKLDYAEDIQVGLLGSRLHFSFFDGSDELTMHHKYSYYYQKTYLDPLPPFDPDSDTDNPHGVDGFIMGRTGTYGGQTVAHAIWPGDLDSDFRHHLDEDYYVGGLPASVIAGTSLGASGYPFYAADTGGFRNGRPSSEVLIRWAWQTAFSPIMQVGGGGSNHFAWDPGNSNEEQYDADTLLHFRAAAQYAIRLSDYRFTWGLHAHETGVPLMRAFGLAYPNDGRHPDDTYLLGPDLLIAPIMSPDPERMVPLPDGQWIGLFDDTLVFGPDEVLVNAPLGTLPVYLRQGAIVPLLRPDVETLLPTTDPETNSLMTDAGELTFIIVPGVEGSYTNHEGTNIAHGPDDSAFWAIEVGRGERFTQLRLDLRFGKDTLLPQSVSLDGETVPMLGSEDEVNSCTPPCAATDPGRGRLMIRLPTLFSMATRTVRIGVQTP